MRKAIDWFTKSAKQGDARAQFNLGAIYKKGIGLMQNYKKAYMWFDLAIHNGYSDKQKLETKWQRNLALKI